MMMEAQPKVSVIIPVYNTEEYLREALDSVLNQTLRNIEIIIINDGSTDGCASIIESYKNEDERIIYLEQENLGQSVARNKGMELAHGVYYYFMDSDDVLRNDALERCYQACEHEVLDFVFFDAAIIQEDVSSFLMDYHHHDIEDRVYDGCEMLDHLVGTCQFRVPPYLYFVRCEFLKENQMSFFPGIIHEDELFAVLLYIKAKRIKYINEEFFYRRIRHASVMTSKISMRNAYGYFTVFRELKRHALELDISARVIINSYIKLTLNAFLSNAHDMTSADKIKTGRLLLHGHFVGYIKMRNFIKFLLP